MTRCSKPGCRFYLYRGRLCYRHWRESQGFVFDAARKLFVKTKQ